MMPDKSYDPRTWKAAGGALPAAPEPVVPPAPEPRPAPGEPARADWIGLGLSVAILLGGAAAAYAMRVPAASLDAPPLSPAVSASG